MTISDWCRGRPSSVGGTNIKSLRLAPAGHWRRRAQPGSGSTAGFCESHRRRRSLLIHFGRWVKLSFVERFEGVTLMSHLSRLHFCSSAALAVAAGPLGLSGFVEKPKAMADVAEQTVGNDTSIRPYRVQFSDAQLAHLRTRIKATRWPDRETVDESLARRAAGDASADLRAYWATGTTGARVRQNSTPCRNIVTTIEGLDIQFIHVRSQHVKRAAAHRHARLARIDHRTAQDHRAADRSDGAWWEPPRMPSTSLFHRYRATGFRQGRP